MGRRWQSRRSIPFTLAAIMWLLSAFGAASGLRPPWDRLLDCATVCVTIGVTMWALLAGHQQRRSGHRQPCAEHDESIAMLLDVILSMPRPDQPHQAQRRLRRVGSESR
jgi:hypothetical protein